MKRLIVLAILLVAARITSLHPVHAQTVVVSGPSFQYVAAKASCATSVGVTVFCYAADSGMLQSINGAAFVQVGGAQPITINGKTGTFFTITATSSVPVVLSNSTSPTVTVSVN